MPIKGERLGDAQRFHVGKTFAVDPTDGLVGEFGKPTQCGTGDVSVTPTQPGGAGTQGSLSSPPGWDAVISGLRPGTPRTTRRKSSCEKEISARSTTEDQSTRAEKELDSF